VNSQSPDPSTFAAARRRSSTVSSTAANSSPAIRRAAVTSANRSVSGSRPTSANAAHPASERRYATSSSENPYPT
jgi:hypothetical protein